VPDASTEPPTADPTLVTSWLRDAEQVVVLTGAGISTESGVPDFRGPQGVWTKNPAAEKTSSLQHYLADPEIRKQAWRNRLASPMWDARPNAGHDALVELERRARFHTLITQNIDGLHQRAGSSPEKIIEIHGNAHGVRCWTCAWQGVMAAVLDRVRNGEDDPACLVCGGILKSTTISFGEQLVAEDLWRGQEAALGADLFLAVGTSLGVHPAAALPELALRQGARLVVANQEPTSFDVVAHAVFREPLGRLLPALVGAI
jgi:NAD-dependent protein deacetylase/lipoamidase